MQELRQSTAYSIRVGPAVNSTGVTPVTNLAITAADQAEILKANTTATLAISGTLTAITNADGWYYLTLTTGETDEIGHMTVVIQDSSLILPIYRDFMILEQNSYDVKYNTTTAMKSTLTALSVSAISTFDSANDGVSLGSATYNTAASFHNSAGAFSTFDSANDGVSLGSAVYTAIGDFRATGFSTFNPASDGVSLGSAVYTAIGDFRASGFSTFDPTSEGVSLGSAVYSSIADFKATGFSTFDAANDGVSLGSAVYSSISDFNSLTAAAVDAVWDEVLTGATHNVASSAGRRLRNVESSIIITGTSPDSGGTANTAIRIELDGDASAVDGAYDPAVINIINGTGQGQSRQIFEYDGSNKYAYINRDWKIVPDSTSEYVIESNAGDTHVNEGLATGGGNTTITLNALASSNNNEYSGQLVFLVAGTGQDQCRRIISYVGATKVATVDRAWNTNPGANATIYAVLPDSGACCEVVEGSLTYADAQRLMMSVLTGESSGGSTTTITFRDIGDTKNRVVATVDAKGNRTNIGTRDGT